jgi:hypothetical protein
VFTLGGRVHHVWGSRLTREAARIGLLGAGVILASINPVAAQDPHTEISTGLEASNNAVSGYLGAGYAFGKGLYERGWRVRAVGSLGSYDYRGTLFDGDAGVGTNFDGNASYGAALVGYQVRAESVIVKLFAGVEAENQRISPHDPDNSVQGSAVGLKFVAESWADLSPLWFLSADAAYGTAFQQYWSLVRIGRRVGPLLSLGLEGGALGNEEYNAGRGGGFVRAKLRAVEITLSGGFTGNYLEDEPSGYVSLGVYRAF